MTAQTGQNLQLANEVLVHADRNHNINRFVNCLETFIVPSSVTERHRLRLSTFIPSFFSFFPMFILFWEWSWMSKTSQAVVEPRGRTTGCSIGSVPTKAATAANTVAIVKSNSPGTHPRGFWLLVQATTITKLLSPPTITWPSSTSSFPATKGDHVVDQLRKGSLVHPAGLTCRSTPLLSLDHSPDTCMFS